MKKTTAAIALIFSFLSGCILTALAVRSSVSVDFPAMNKVREVYRVLDTYYIGQTDDALMCDVVADAMVYATGDRWSYYIPAEEYDSHVEQIENVYVGIGVTLGNDEDGRAVVLEVAPNGSALEAGIAVGDEFVTIDGVDCTELSIPEIRTLVRGEEGSTVTITVRRGEEQIDIPMERRSMQTEVVRFDLIGDVGYIAIYNFDATAAEKTISAIEILRANDARALVFDVRNNPGGLKTELVRLLDYLLPEGVLFRSEDYLGRKETDSSDAYFVDLPMAVLINEDSYSAAEFFAAALSEYGVAKTVGTKTCGKGYFQAALPLSDGSAINLSIGKYYTPAGVSLADVGGLQPDETLELSEEQTQQLMMRQLNPRDDPQFRKAVSLLE